MLTNATVKAAQASARPYKLADAGGLYLYVRPSGSKTFRMKYRFGRKEKLLTIGSWPEVTLGDARARRDSARELLRKNVDPAGKTSTHHDLMTFERLARRWFERRRQRWSDEHATDVIASLERDVFPAIGADDPATIDAQAVLRILLEVEGRGCIESARRLRERISGVFRLGILLQICNADPAALTADELSQRPVQVPQAALTEIDQARELLADAEAAAAPAIVKLASRLLALTAVRMATLRGAQWSELEGVNWEGETVPSGNIPLWRIPPARMKLTKVKKADPSAEHLIPLSRQTLAVLREVRALELPGDLIFPGRRRGRPIGEGAIGDLYAAAGYSGRHVPHGWRATFSTILNNRFPDQQQLIDQALAHVGKKGKVEAAYNRAQHLDRQRELFQRWADLVAPEA